jgi:hypothetical protein
MIGTVNLPVANTFWQRRMMCIVGFLIEEEVAQASVWRIPKADSCGTSKAMCFRSKVECVVKPSNPSASSLKPGPSSFLLNS